jgi:hypothetical protein
MATKVRPHNLTPAELRRSLGVPTFICDGCGRVIRTDTPLCEQCVGLGVIEADIATGRTSLAANSAAIDALFRAIRRRDGEPLRRFANLVVVKPSKGGGK